MNEIKRMQTLAGINEIKINSPYQPINIFNGIDDEDLNSGLLKIENVPSLRYNSEEYDCPSGEWDKFLVDNPSIKEVLEKISNTFLGPGYDVRKDVCSAFNIVGDFKSPIKQAYIYMGGDGECFITNSLNYFDAGYNTEEEWGISQWKEI